MRITLPRVTTLHSAFINNFILPIIHTQVIPIEWTYAMRCQQIQPIPIDKNRQIALRWETMTMARSSAPLQRIRSPTITRILLFFSFFLSFFPTSVLSLAAFSKTAHSLASSQPSLATRFRRLIIIIIVVVVVVLGSFLRISSISMSSPLPVKARTPRRGEPDPT